MSKEVTEAMPPGFDPPESGAPVSRYRFDEFEIDVSDRQLWRGSTRIDLNTRYFDALVLLVRKRGRLVDKSRLFRDVWGDVIVSDSALTQCIKEIRRQLGDDASDPRFIQTVPRHGYRFVAEVELVTRGMRPAASQSGKAGNPGLGTDTAVREKRHLWLPALIEWGAGSAGGALAGLLGGMLYGFGLAATDTGGGTLSTLLVIVTLCTLVGLTGGLGVSLGLAAGGITARFLPGQRGLLRVGGAAFGGLFVGTLVKLLSVDAFNLLFGRAPAGITGGPEGAVLGGAIILGAWVGCRSGRGQPWQAITGAGLGGAAVGTLIPLAGGSLMSGSLHLLAGSFVDSRLRLDTFGPLFGELQFGLATRMALTGIEGLLFGVCVVGVLTMADRYGRYGNDPWSL